MAGISYAGVPLLLDYDQQVQDWLDRWLPLDDLRLIGAWPTGVWDNQANLPLPNYSRPQRVKLNTWYRPVGASRWSFGLFLATTSKKDEILGKVGSQNSFQALQIEYPPGFSRGWIAYLLPPRPVSDVVTDGNGLWLIPIVDERWYWQFISAHGLSINDSTAWGAVFSYLADLLGITLDVDVISSDFGTPHVTSLNVAANANAAVMLDAIAHSVGQRIFLKYEEAGPRTYVELRYKSGNFSTSRERISFNVTQQNAGTLQSGELTVVQQNFAALIPQSVNVVFRKWANGIIWDDEFYAKNKTADLYGWSGSTSAYTKTIYTTALADYTSGGGFPDNQTACDNLANALAYAFYGYLGWIQDSTYIGCAPWIETGFDDYVEFAMGGLLPDGSYQCRTRVHSLPFNFACERALNQLADTHEYPELIEGILAGDLAALGTQTIAVYEGLPATDSGRTVVVTNRDADTRDGGSAIAAHKVNKIWRVDSVSGGTGAGTTTILAQAQAFGQAGDVVNFKVLVATGTKGSETATGSTVAAYVRKGLVISGNNYELTNACPGSDADYEVDNPELDVVVSAGSTVLCGNSVTATVLHGTKGSETTTSSTISAWIRFGLVINAEKYRAIWTDNGFEIENPRIRFRGVADATILQNTTDTVSIYYRSGSTAYTDTGVNATVLNDLDGTVEAGAVVEVMYDPYGDTEAWRIIQADCPT